MPSQSTHPHTLCPSFLVAIAIFSVFTLSGIVSAAWVDAPNAPPNYGITGCTYPCLQADFQPMNLSAAPQIKKGSISATGFFDTDNPLYFIDPAEPVFFSANLAGHTVINGTAIIPGAQLVVNNPKTSGKIGAAGDTIYSYNNSTNAAVSAEQGNPAGYGIYASGGQNYFQGNVGIGTASPAQTLDVVGRIKSSGGFVFPDNTVQTTAVAAHGQQLFITNGTFVVPAGVTGVRVTMSGGGGGGGGGASGYVGGFAQGGGGGGGGGSGDVFMQQVPVSPGASIPVVVGVGGYGGAGAVNLPGDGGNGGWPGGNGGISWFGPYGANAAGGGGPGGSPCGTSATNCGGPNATAGWGGNLGGYTGESEYGNGAAAGGFSGGGAAGGGSGGAGARNIFGRGGGGGFPDGNGYGAAAYGSGGGGGGGGSNRNNGGAGGAGTPGFVRVEW